MKSHTSLEALESRIAPATLLSASSFSYLDVDGDNVKVTFSKPILSEKTFNSIVNISGGLAERGPQDLIGLDLQDLGTNWNGLNITITATPKKFSSGDGQIAGVYIDAFDYDEGLDQVFGIDLGVVTVDGDLTSIDAGDADTTTLAIKALNAKTIGMVEPGALSDVFGSIGTVKVTRDFAGYLYVDSDDVSRPDIRTLTIGGSIVGSLGEDAGRIFAFAGIANALVKGDIIGGDFAETGSIRTAYLIAKLTVNGSIIGGDADDTGKIRAFELGNVSVKGSLVGAFGHRSGVIETFAGNIGNVVIGGSIFGGLGDESGNIRALADLNTSLSDEASIRSVTIKGSVLGIVPESGNVSLGTAILADNSIGRVTVHGFLKDASIIAGILPGTDNLYGTIDDSLTAGFPDAFRSLGPVQIKSGVSATVEGYAFTALAMTSVQAGGPVLKAGGTLADFDNGFLLGGGSGIQVIRF